MKKIQVKTAKQLIAEGLLFEDQISATPINPNEAICLMPFKNTSEVMYFIMGLGIEAVRLRQFWSDAIELKNGAGYLISKSNFKSIVLPLFEGNSDYELDMSEIA